MPQNNTKLKSILLAFTFLGIGIVLGLLVSFFIPKNQKNNLPSDKNNVTTNNNDNKVVKSNDNNSNNSIYTKPVSSEKGYPIVDRDSKKLMIYNFSTNSLQNTNITDFGWGSGSLGLGSSDINSSPTYLYSAYINDTDDSLYILSHETLESVKVPNSKGVMYISGWNSSGDTVVFYGGKNDITMATQGMGIPDTYSFSKENLIDGFYSFNINTGETTKLTPLNSFISYINNKDILTELSNFEDRLVIFDTNSFVADFNSVKGDYGFGVGQFDFTIDGKKWTFTHSYNPTEDANIIYATFPNQKGVVVDSGNWADVQNSKFSPSGKYITYSKDVIPNNGTSSDGIMIYNTNTKKKELLTYGYDADWIDESTIVVKRSKENNLSVTNYFIVKYPSKTEDKIY